MRHVFRLLKTALDANRGVEWVLLENVSGFVGGARRRRRGPDAKAAAWGRRGSGARPAPGLAHPRLRLSSLLPPQVEAILDRGTERDDLPPIAWLAAQFEGLGYMSWAHRVVNAAGARRGEGGRGKR